MNYKKAKDPNNRFFNKKEISPIFAKTSMNALILSGDKTKLLASGVDNSIIVYKILRNSSQMNAVEGIETEKIIMNDSLITNMKSFKLAKELIVAGFKDGRVKMINISSGRTTKEFKAAQNSII